MSNRPKMVSRRLPLPDDWWPRIDGARLDGEPLVGVIRSGILAELDRRGVKTDDLSPVPKPGNPAGIGDRDESGRIRKNGPE